MNKERNKRSNETAKKKETKRTKGKRKKIYIRIIKGK